LAQRKLKLKKKVLILGSAGLIGHQVYNYLSKDRSYQLSNISHTRKLNNNTVLVNARNEAEFTDEVNHINPDYIINCIGVLITESKKDPANAIYLNSYLPHKLLTLANAINAKLIHISSDCVFSGRKDQPYIESDYKDGTGIYSESKSLGEFISLNHLIIRTSVVGPELSLRDEELFNWFMNQDSHINGFSKSIWSGVTTLELAKAIKFFIENETVGLYHLTNNRSISKYELLTLFKIFTNKTNMINKIDGLASNKSFIDTRKEINYKIPSYNKMIKDMVSLIKNDKNLYKHYNL